ncbi:MAG: radical SAM protein [Deltaproteobacteria bacterium]|nr:radical SAM protein [Deltaproteobacteria bacterium]
MLNFRFGRQLTVNEETYDFPPFRPPSEADSLLLRLTRGCPWNRCAFCPMYKDVKFERRTIEEVKKDIDTAQDFIGGTVDTVFIGDSDSLVINTEAICEILEHLYSRFPSIGRVTSYARSQTLKHKSADNLKAIRDAGLTRLHIGLETGNAHLLKKMRKGAGPDTMITGGAKAREAGFEVSLYVLLGIGGVANWSEHAYDTASVLNRMAPDFIRVRTLTPQPGTRVYQWLKDGSFKMPNPEGILKEQRRLIENLNLDCEYLSDHVSNYAPVNGMLPRDKPAMLSMIDNTLERLTRDHEFKGDLEQMPFQRRL